MVRYQDIDLEFYGNADVCSQSVTPSVSSMTGNVDFAIRIEVLAVPRTPKRCHFHLKRATIGWLHRIPLFFAFLIINSVFGIVAFVVVVLGSTLSVALLPLCGFGVIVFQALGVATEKLAWLDIVIANLLIHDKRSEALLRVHPGIKMREFAIPDRVTIDNEVLSALPPSSGNIVIIRVMVYFATAKPAVAALSWVMVAFITSFPTIAFSESRMPVLSTLEHKYADKPAVLVLTVVGIFVLGVVLLVLLAMLSRELTVLVCADTAPIGISAE